MMHLPDRQSAHFNSPEKYSPRSSCIATRSSSPSSTGSFPDLASTLDLKDYKYGPYANLPFSSKSYKPGSVDARNTTPSKSVVLGVCAMDVKARSKAMREILTRLVERSRGVIEVKVFGDKVILDEGIRLAFRFTPLC
jgi:inositol hexakisphosphate/diphosphoinositol-pentakisphosphate kinase